MAKQGIHQRQVSGGRRALACGLVAVLCVGAALAQGTAPTVPAGPTVPGKPPTVQRVSVPSLSAPGQILVDTWGVPHIYAANEDDLFFLQGYNTARDRLFQVDLWRRRGLGRLSAVFGERFVEQDRAARLLLYRGDMAREWAAYGPGAQRIATRFVAGINAYIDQLGSSGARLPFEFAQFGYRPEKWQPEDVVRIRSHGLARNLSSEYSRAWLSCRGEPGADALRMPLSPAWDTRMPEGLDPCIPYEVMQTYYAGTQELRLNARDGRRATAPELTPPGSPDDTRLAALEPPARSTALVPPARMEGSNAWVVSPARSATGRPILASDPHRAHSAPSLRYIVHLNAPGLSVIGAGEPALPGVSIGHNGRVAFGLTIFGIDQDDLYAYETRPGEPRSYQYQGRWEAMQTVTETIEVRGRPAVSVELLFTRHGPVLHADPTRNRAWALRSVWFEPGTAPYFGSIAYMRAQDFAGFRRAMADWGTPAENQVYADSSGQIGWVVGGRAPIRPNWDGLWPVPGDGRYEWAGFQPGDALPWVHNPSAGWFATANEMNLPAGFPYRERKLGFEWPGPSRQQRIAEVLSRGAKHSLEDSMRLQHDVVSLPARRLQAVLRNWQGPDAKARLARDKLLDWDARVSADSGAAALFELWWSRYLGAAFREATMPRGFARVFPYTDDDLLIGALERPDSRWPGQGAARRDDILARSLAQAWDEAQQLLGADPRKWRWDRLLHIVFTHPLAAATDAGTQTRLNVGPVPQQGSGDTVNMSTFSPGDFRRTSGASFRMVLDVGQWDNSRAVNAPGQSGDPASAHYRDLVPLWRRGDYFPLLYSREKVQAATRLRIELAPAVGSAKPTGAASGPGGK